MNLETGFTCADGRIESGHVCRHKAVPHVVKEQRRKLPVGAFPWNGRKFWQTWVD